MAQLCPVGSLCEKHHQASLVKLDTCRAAILSPSLTCAVKCVWCSPALFSCVCSSRWTESGGRGLTTSDSKNSFRDTRRAAAPRVSQPLTIWPRPPAGPFSEPEREGSTLQTHVFRERTRPKISRGADVEYSCLSFLLGVGERVCTENIWSRPSVCSTLGLFLCFYY